MAATLFRHIFLTSLCSVVLARRGLRTQDRRCRVADCVACMPLDPTSCRRCRPGFGLTTEKRCAACASDCARCDDSGPGRCDRCNVGHAATADGSCRACALSCRICDVAGAGQCDKGGCVRRFVFEPATAQDLAPPPGWDEGEDGVWEPAPEAVGGACVRCASGCFACVNASVTGCVTCDSLLHTTSARGCALSDATMGCVAVFVLVVGVWLCAVHCPGHGRASRARQAEEMRCRWAMASSSRASVASRVPLIGQRSSTSRASAANRGAHRRPLSGLVRAGGVDD